MLANISDAYQCIWTVMAQYDSRRSERVLGWKIFKHSSLPHEEDFAWILSARSKIREWDKSTLSLSWSQILLNRSWISFVSKFLSHPTVLLFSFRMIISYPDSMCVCASRSSALRDSLSMWNKSSIPIFK